MAGMLVGGMIGALVTSLVAVGAGVLFYRRFVQVQSRVAQAERLAELGTLTGGLAHEIKNVLSTVQLNLRLLEEDFTGDFAPSPPPPPAPLPESHTPIQQPVAARTRILNRLQNVQRETVRLREIVADFLKYAGKMELDCRPTNIHALLEELVDFFSPQAQVHRVQVRLKPAQGPLMASVDAKLIKQAVLDLMINAVQEMSNNASGSPTSGNGELILSAGPADGQPVGQIAIDVIDTGSGIPPEALDKIFEAYYSTKRSGTGLGLAMVRRIAQEHGGRITVRSEPGKGSDFTLILPVDHLP